MSYIYISVLSKATKVVGMSIGGGKSNQQITKYIPQLNKKTLAKHQLFSSSE